MKQSDIYSLAGKADLDPRTVKKYLADASTVTPAARRKLDELLKAEERDAVDKVLELLPEVLGQARRLQKENAKLKRELAELKESP
ncbi:MAG: hypothetical protein R3B72_05915 [Polyangiaceae bacterium]